MNGHTVGGGPAAWLPPWLRGRWGMAGLAAAAYCLLLAGGALWRQVNTGGPSHWLTLAALPLNLFAGAAAWRLVARRGLDRRLRRAWRLLGLAVLTQFVANLIQLLMGVEREIALSQTPMGVLYLFVYPLALLGLLNLPRAPATRLERLKVILDLGIVVTVGWMVVGLFIIGPVADRTGSGLVERLWATALPVSDVLLLGGIMALLFRQADRATRSALWLYLGGLVCFVASDLYFAYRSLDGSYVPGGLADTGWLAASLFFGWAALRQPAAIGDALHQRWWTRLVPILSLLLPLGAAGLGYGLVIVAAAASRAPAQQLPALLTQAGLLTVLILARQVVSLRENMQLTASLTALSLRLEERVVERTAQLEEAQAALSHSEKLAITGTLASEVVHEVSNPLNTVLAASEALEAELGETGQVAPDSLQTYLPILARAAGHAAQVMQALRGYARGGASERVPQDITGVIADALLLLAGPMRRWEGVRLQTEYEPDLPPVVCDRHQIAQLVINLLNNARDAMPRGGQIRLSVRRAMDGAGVQIEVADQGVGIPADQLGRVFEPFFTTKPIGVGSGLGLAVVSRIARLHHGTVTVHSDGPGQGTAFRVTLPAARRAPATLQG